MQVSEAARTGGGDEFSVLFGGDIGPVRQPVSRLADEIQPFLDTADFRFGQCERTYSTRGAFPHWETIPRGEWSRLSPEYAEIFRAARIDVASLASNHALDWGQDPLDDTIALFRDWGIKSIGAGRNEEEARAPAYLEKDGVTVAVLAYATVIRDGWAAIGEHPGVAPIRARTWYEDVDFQPGCPPIVRSEAVAEDVAKAADDIRAAKERADAVVVSLHWGVRYIPKTLAEYQQPVAHALIDAGADLLVGHHAHVPKAVEVRDGAVCLYSIGNFLTTGIPADKPRQEWNLYWHEPPPDSLYAFSPQSKQSLLPRVTFSKRGVERVGLSLARINDLAQPMPLASGDPEFESTLEYLEWVSDHVPHRFEVEGDEVVVTAP